MKMHQATHSIAPPPTMYMYLLNCRIVKLRKAPQTVMHLTQNYVQQCLHFGTRRCIFIHFSPLGYGVDFLIQQFCSIYQKLEV